MPGCLRLTILILAWVLVALSAVGIAGYFYRAGNSVTLAVSALAPYLLFLALPALVLFVIVRQWPPAVVAVGVLAFFVVVQAATWRAATADRGAAGLTVMTFNLRIGEADAAAVVREVRRYDVDVLLLQELTPTAESRLRTAGLDDLLPHHLSEPGPKAKGTGLWSRWGLTEVDWPPLSFNRVVARVAVPEMPVEPTVAALHVAGPVPSTLNWGIDLQRLPALMRDLPRDAPVIAGGDFNATRSVAQFRDLLDGGYTDAADQAGAGLARTYPSNSWLPPVLGIDHVLTRDGVATSADTVTIAGSDHRALVVRLALGTSNRSRDTR